MNLETFNFPPFSVPKNCYSPYKIHNKTRSTKNLENVALQFGDNYLTNHLVKILEDRIKPWRVGAHRVCTGYHLFKIKSLVRAFQPSLTLHVVCVNNTH